ncbi:MAG TPA: site-2 protease family protein [Gemmatimonadales bacterium]|nr:site-2 protease family protein [Gemmatimonadales bacterium]
MRWSYRIGRIAGTDLKVHLTFLLLLAFFAWEGYQVGGAAGAVTESLLILAIFACVAFHEFGHILMARRFGIRTPDILLLPIGGVARLEKIPDEPRRELAIALAGPAVTLAIAVVLYLVLLATGQTITEESLNEQGPFLVQLMAINVFLLLFNLIPAFPMDGGRVLRSLLATRMGLVRATKTAAAVGQMLAIGFGLVAIFMAFNPILLLIAVFIYFGAGAEAAAMVTRTVGRGIVVQQMMVTDFRTLRVYATLADAAAALMETEQREFPIVDNDGRLEGLLTRDHLMQGLTAHGPGATVGQVMTAHPPTLTPEVGFAEALQALRNSRLPALPVVDHSGSLVGLVTMANISDLLALRQATSGS